MHFAKCRTVLATAQSCRLTPPHHRATIPAVVKKAHSLPVLTGKAAEDLEKDLRKSTRAYAKRKKDPLARVRKLLPAVLKNAEI